MATWRYKIFQHEKRKFASPCGHVISSIISIFGGSWRRGLIRKLIQMTRIVTNALMLCSMHLINHTVLLFNQILNKALAFKMLGFFYYNYYFNGRYMYTVTYWLKSPGLIELRKC